jgi:hypothetical protein
MSRPRKDDPRPDTALVTFRFPRDLLAALDEHARDASEGRSDSVRRLLRQALDFAERDPTQRRRPARPLRDRVLEAVQATARGIIGTASLADVRDRLARVPRTLVDRELSALDRECRVALGKPVDLARLTERERAAAFNDRIRGMLVYVTVSHIPARTGLQVTSGPPQSFQALNGQALNGDS